MGRESIVPTWLIESVSVSNGSPLPARMRTRVIAVGSARKIKSSRQPDGTRFQLNSGGGNVHQEQPR